MPHHSTSADRVSLPAAARNLGLSSPGALKIIQRANFAIRDDGRWYVFADKLEEIAKARRLLGIDRSPKTTQVAA